MIADAEEYILCNVFNVLYIFRSVSSFKYVIDQMAKEIVLEKVEPLVD